MKKEKDEEWESFKAEKQDLNSKLDKLLSLT